MAEPDRLDDAAVGQRLARTDELLERVEGVPGPTSDAAIEAVQTLTELYGEALARVLDLVDAGTAGRFADDELLAHLLVLHDLHPDPVERRVARVVEGLRPAVTERGGDVELLGIEDGVAHVRLTAKGCGSSTDSLHEAVRDAVLAVAPELSEVRPAAEERDPAFVPLTTLTTRPSVGAGGPA
ncbi:NifU family protein [Streptomyces sp. TR06-5]|uniref:NifU family protein n=1 Tax=unclassified Streptomyces TaxID=2593676 RepID=UPI0039A2F72D